jgi:hypothetical protein
MMMGGGGNDEGDFESNKDPEEEAEDEDEDDEEDESLDGLNIDKGKYHFDNLQKERNSYKMNM